MLNQNEYMQTSTRNTNTVWCVCIYNIRFFKCILLLKENACMLYASYPYRSSTFSPVAFIVDEKMLSFERCIRNMM